MERKTDKEMIRSDIYLHAFYSINVNDFKSSLQWLTYVYIEWHRFTITASHRSNLLLTRFSDTCCMQTTYASIIWVFITISSETLKIITHAFVLCLVYSNIVVQEEMKG